MYCRNCGQDIGDFEVCRYCGTINEIIPSAPVSEEHREDIAKEPKKKNNKIPIIAAVAVVAVIAIVAVIFFMRKNGPENKWVSFMNKMESSIEQSGIKLKNIDTLTAEETEKAIEKYGLTPDDADESGCDFYRTATETQGNYSFYVTGMAGNKETDVVLNFFSLYCSRYYTDDSEEENQLDWSKWPDWMSCVKEKTIEDSMKAVGITQDMVDYVRENGEKADDPDVEDRYMITFVAKNKKLKVSLYFDKNNDELVFMNAYHASGSDDRKTCGMGMSAEHIAAGYDYSLPGKSLILK